MKTIKKILLAFIFTVFWLTHLSFYNLASAQNVYDWVLNRTTSSKWWSWALSSALRGWDDIVKDAKWADLFNAQVIVLIGYAIDIFIVVGIAIAFIGWYKIMMSNKEDSSKEWIRMVVFGVLWIIIMASARFLAEWLVWSNGIISDEFTVHRIISKDGLTVSTLLEPRWVTFATALYEKILFPFIKVALYLVTWILFFMMVVKVLWYVTSTDDSVKKKAWWVIIRCVIGILIVMWSKQLVESVMWKQEIVINENVEWINEQTPWSVLNFGTIPIITQVINRVMWLTMFIVLVLIIIQWYRMFTKPDDPKNRERLKKTLLYIIIWVLVIWASYAISQILVINNIPITAS